jgi:hypothetical protein
MSKMTHESAWQFLHSREASLNFVSVHDGCVATISYLNGSIKAQSTDLVDAVEKCISRERDLILQQRISDRTPLMARIIEWHKQNPAELKIAEEPPVVEMQPQSKPSDELPNQTGFQRRKTV